MERHGDETHITTDEVRGGESTGIQRYVLLIGLILAIGALSLIWMSGAWFNDQANDPAAHGPATYAP